MLQCELTGIHLLLLDLITTLFPSFLLDDLNTMTIYFTYVNVSTIQSKLNLKSEKTFNIMIIKNQLTVWYLQQLTELSL